MSRVTKGRRLSQLPVIMLRYHHRTITNKMLPGSLYKRLEFFSISSFATSTWQNDSNIQRLAIDLKQQHTM